MLSVLTALDGTEETEETQEIEETDSVAVPPSDWTHHSKRPGVCERCSRTALSDDWYEKEENGQKVVACTICKHQSDRMERVRRLSRAPPTEPLNGGQTETGADVPDRVGESGAAAPPAEPPPTFHPGKEARLLWLETQVERLRSGVESLDVSYRGYDRLSLTVRCDWVYLDAKAIRCVHAVMHQPCVFGLCKRAGMHDSGFTTRVSRGAWTLNSQCDRCLLFKMGRQVLFCLQMLFVMVCSYLFWFS